MGKIITKFANQEELKQLLSIMLVNDMSLTEIADQLNTSSTTIHNWIKKLDLAGRRQNLRSKEFLYQKYIIENLNMADIASLCGVTYQAVGWYLDKFKIEKRPNSEIQKEAAKTKRKYSSKHFPLSKLNSRGYVTKFKNKIFHSAAELTYGFILDKQQIEFETQFETFYLDDGRLFRPDFRLVSQNKIEEIKANKLTDHELNYYHLIESKLNKLGYEYEIIYVQNLYKKEYTKTLEILRSKGCKPGFYYAWEDKNPLI